MNFNTVLDLSAFIWDETNYNANKNQYYKLTDAVSLLIFKLSEEKSIILMRDELLNEIWLNFPYNKIPSKYSDFETQTLSFLSNVGRVSFSDMILSDIYSIPDLVKTYYKPTIKKEVKYLISKIHSDTDSENVYFTFNYFWNNSDKLKTIKKTETKEYQTIIADNNNDLDNFFVKRKLVFEHKESKHDCSIHKSKDAWMQADNKGNFESQLSCYCDKNIEKVQKILDRRYLKCFGNEFYYSYDFENKVYVVFRKTLNNVFHAYDMYDIERVPLEVRKHFNIWKY